MADVDASSYVIVVGMMCLSVAMIFWPTRKAGNVRYLCPIRWAGVGFFILFGLQPFNHLYYNEIAFDRLDSSVFDPMGLACIASAASFIAGWIMARPSHGIGANHVAALEPDAISYSGAAPNRGAVDNNEFKLLLIPAAFSIVTLIGPYHNMYNFWESSTNPYELIGGDFYNIFCLFFGSLAAFALFGLAGTNGRSSRFSVALAILAGGLYFLFSLKLGARLRILFLVMGLMGILSAKMRTRTFLRWMFIMSLLTLFFIYTFARIGRYEFSFGHSLTAFEEFLEESHDYYYDFFMAGDFDAFENGMQVMRAAKEQHFLYGSTLVSVLYNPIPRSIWPDKPSPTVTELLVTGGGYGRGAGTHLNIGCALPAEFYANFGWIGIVVGMLIFGMVSRRLYERFGDRPYDGIAQVHLGLFCAYLLLVFRGSFHSMTIFYLMIIIWPWIAKLANYFTPSMRMARHHTLVRGSN